MVTNRCNLLPPALKEEHRDVLIIFSDSSLDDRRKAEELQEAVEGFCFADNITGKAVVLDYAVLYVRSFIERLDEALKFNTLTLVIYSVDLANDLAVLQTSNAVLWHTIEERSKKNTFIPVLWKDGAVLPTFVRELQPLDMRKNGWKDKFKELISSHLCKRLQRESVQERAQEEYLRKNHPQLLSSSTSTNSHHVLEPSAIQHHSDTENLVDQPSLGNLDVHGCACSYQQKQTELQDSGWWNCFRTVATSYQKRIQYGAVFIGLMSIGFVMLRVRQNNSR